MEHHLGNVTAYQGYPHYAFVLPFEEEYEHVYTRIWMSKNWHVCFYISAVYLMTVTYLHSYMKNRPAMKLRNAVLAWDVILAVFSTAGMVRTVPEILFVLRNFGLEFSVCNSSCNSVTAFWGAAFAFSKAPELLDTIFIVLKKQKLTALHLIHHVFTLLITWYHYTDHPALSRWVFGMNYSIHAFMYSYYALKAAKVYVPNSVSMAITSAQILQMVCGLVASVYSVWAILLGVSCSTTLHVALSGIFIYVSFLYLFVNFFLHRYVIFDIARKKLA